MSKEDKIQAKRDAEQYRQDLAMFMSEAFGKGLKITTSRRRGVQVKPQISK